MSKALQAIEAAIEHGGKLTTRFPHAPLKQRVVAATHDGGTVEGSVKIATALAILHHPQINEHPGEEPLPSHATAGNPSGADEFVNFALFNPQVGRHLSGRHQFWLEHEAFRY
jgi:hypothetical protein